MTHFVVTDPIARKEHRCSLCGRKILPGEKHLRGAGMDGGTAWTWRECAHCDSIRDVARHSSYDSEYSDDLISEWEPTTLAHMRLKAMWRRKWTRGDGTLYPVPRKIMYEDEHHFGWQVAAEAVEI